MRGRTYVNPRDFGASGEGQVWTRGRIEAGARQVVVESAASFYPGQGLYLYAEDGSRLSTLITAIEGRTLEFRDSWPGPSGPVSVYHDDTWAILNALLRFGTHGEGRLDNLDSRALSMCFPPGQYNLSRTITLASHQAWVGGDGISDSAAPAVLAALPGFAPDPAEERFILYEHFDRIGTGTNSFWLYLRNLRLIGLRPETNPGLSCLHYMGSHTSVVEKVGFAGFRRCAISLPTQDTPVFTGCVFDASQAPVSDPVVRFANPGPWTAESLTFDRCTWIGNNDPNLVGVGMVREGYNSSWPESCAWRDCIFDNVGRPIVLQGKDVSIVSCHFRNSRFPPSTHPAIEVEAGSEAFNVVNCTAEGYATAVATPEERIAPDGSGSFAWFSSAFAQRQVVSSGVLPAEPPRPAPVLGRRRGAWLNVKDFGASGDTTTFTSAEVVADGRQVVLRDASSFARGQGLMLYRDDDFTVSKIVDLEGAVASLEPPTRLRGQVQARHDDTAALQAAIEAASQAGAVLFFPHGEYPTSDTLYAGDYTDWLGGEWAAHLVMFVPSASEDSRYVVSFEKARPDRRIQRLTKLTFTPRALRRDLPPQPVGGCLLNVNSPMILTSVWFGFWQTGTGGAFTGPGLHIRGHTAGLLLKGILTNCSAGGRASLLMEDCRHVYLKGGTIDGGPGSSATTVELVNCHDIEIGNLDSEVASPRRSLRLEGGSDIHIRSWFNRWMWSPGCVGVEMVGSPRNVSISMMDFPWYVYFGGQPDPQIRMVYTYDGEKVLDVPHAEVPQQGQYWRAHFWSNVPARGPLPGRVAHLTAEVMGESVRLSWPPVPGATAYRVYASEGADEDYLYLATVATPGYEITGVGSQIPTGFVVRACTERGGGPPSPPAIIHAAAGEPAPLPPFAPLFDYPPPPEAPDDAKIVPGDGQILVRTGDDPMAPFLLIERAAAPEGPWEQIARRPHNLAVVTGLENGRPAWFRVRKAHYFGVSEPSAPVQLTLQEEQPGQVVAREGFEQANGGAMVGTPDAPAQEGTRFVRLTKPFERRQFGVWNLKLGARYGLRFWARSNHAGVPVFAGGWQDFRDTIRQPGVWQQVEIPNCGHGAQGDWLAIYFFTFGPRPGEELAPDTYLDLDNIQVFRME